MGPRNAGIIASRILALYLVVETISAIISFVLVARSLEGTSSFWAYVGPRLVIAWLLWILADRIGTGIAAGTGQTEPAAHPLIDLQTVAFVVVGLIFVMQAIPAMIETAITNFPPVGDFAPLRLGPYGGFGDRTGIIVGQVFRLLLGLSLMLGARQLATALRGRDRNEPPAA